jgi:hypothetical protein
MSYPVPLVGGWPLILTVNHFSILDSENYCKLHWKLKAERMESFPLSLELILPWLTARNLFFNNLLEVVS